MNDLPSLFVRTGDFEQKFNGTWYRGEHTNFIPSRSMLKAKGALEKYILEGWLPNKPFIDRKMPITAFGSCFAYHVSEWLDSQGYNVNGKDLNLNSHIVRFGEGIVNTFAIREQIEWALEGKSLEEGLWFGAGKEIVLPDEAVRADTERLLKRSMTLIVTLGLSEIWYDKQSGRAFWRAIPANMFDENRHGFRVSSVDENRDNLIRISELARKHIPNCRVIYTLSPIPLMATFRPISCLTANSVSKAILRVAIDEALQQAGEHTYYFPSYEIVKDFFVDAYVEDNRHVKPEIIDFVMRTFGKYYCV